MAITVDEFHDKFPEFCDIEDAPLQMSIDEAVLLMGSESRWLTFYDIAQAYYVAHLVTCRQYQLAGDSSNIAPMRRQEVDDVVIENAVSDIAPDSQEVLSTSYGKRFAQYRAMCFTGGWVA